MTEREMMELAAKAAGIELKPLEVTNKTGDDRFIGYMTDPSQCQRGWFDPLNDDGDALRLAVKLNIHVLRYETMTTARPLFGIFGYDERDDGDPYAATRLAIFRAAVEIGRGM